MHFEYIEDIDDLRLWPFICNREQQLLKRNCFIGESELIINRALNRGYEVVSFLIVVGHEEDYIELFNLCPEAIAYCVSEEIYRQLKGYILTRGIQACFKRKDDTNIETILSGKRIVVLEDVVNPNNMGAIFRNVAAFGLDGVILVGDCCDPLFRRSVRVSMGNVFGVPFSYLEMENYIEYLKQNGFKTVALALSEDYIEIDDPNLKREPKLALLLGSEGYGLNKESIKQCDYVCKIRMNEGVDSLNVACASGIAMWELGKY